MGGKRQRGVSNFLAKPVGETKAISQGDAFPVHLVKFDTTGLIILISCTIKTAIQHSVGITVRDTKESQPTQRVWQGLETTSREVPLTVLSHPSLHKTSSWRAASH